MMSVPPRELRQLRRERGRGPDRGRGPRASAATRRRRLAALAALALAAAAVVVVAVTAGGSGGPNASAGRSSAESSKAPGHRAGHSGGASKSTAATAKGTGVPGDATVPILMYHVINPPPAGVPYTGLYVPLGEFAAQMQALKAAGWHAVTMDQLEANWKRGASLGAGKPIVLSFDNGYASQYTNALPVLKRLGWVGVENLQLSGLPPSEGGLTDGQVRGLVRAGWELDTQGISHADLITLDSAGLRYQIDTARQTLRQRYGVPVNWFCYPSGDYNSTVIAAVRAAGFVGSTTVVPGWASRSDDPYRLPRLRVLAGTSPTALLAQIASAQTSSAPPPSYG